MRRLLICVLFMLMFSGFSQGMNPINISPLYGNITVQADTSYSVVITTNNVTFSIANDNRDKFIEYINANLSLLDEVTKLGIENNNYIAAYLTLDRLVLSTEVRVKNSNVTMRIYVKNLDSFTFVELNKSQLLDLTSAFNSGYNYNKKISTSDTTILKLIVEMRKKFA